ncbi:hypothetical protein V0R48_11455 [Pseudomonas alcaligenes]|jgi:hypothetical protein|uniref:hypothetical protein n=1 Tax=Pseudomonadaceae TaxID=135621 RepID=UPI0014742C56|nr:MULTISPECIES: hypothetical protein [Pseudomonas]MEE1949591.1 hypothetical protein [Pseudomonas alcaligenes]NMY40032.1 hypothetical protein [Pseudomonas sp. WS 5013]
MSVIKRRSVSKRAVLIFVLGQAQALMLPALVREYEGEAVFVFSVYPVPRDLGVRVINIKPSSFFDGGALILWAVIVGWRLKRFSEVVIFTPHILNFMANKFYYLCRDRVSLFFLFDGILNYRKVLADQEPMLSYQRRQRFKSGLVLHRYRAVRGRVVDTQLEGAKGLVGPEGIIESRLDFDLPVKKIPLLLGGYSPQRAVLVLEPRLEGAALSDFQSRLSGIIKSQYSDCTVLVKPHPSLTKSALSFTELEKFCVSVQLLANTAPAELMFAEYGCIAVFSSLSSALLLIKAVFPSVDAYAILTGDEIKDFELRRIVGLMESVGVVLV